MSLKLISVNIERSKHLDRVIPFLKKEAPDVIAVQELCEQDIPRFEAELGTKCIYAHVGLHPADLPETGSVMLGVAIFTSLPVVRTSIEYYSGSEAGARTDTSSRLLLNLPILVCDIEKDGVFRIATSHFMWTPNGEQDENQRAALAQLMPLLEKKGEFVLAGDMNAPRGGETFGEFAKRLTDNIPAEYTTSIDGNLHRAGQLNLMVDGLFTTPEYTASDVRLESGVSDHCAIVASITRSKSQ